MAEDYYIGPDGKEVSAGVLVITKDDEILCCHGTGKKFEDFTYDLPKGHIDNGETAIQAAVRELKEETNLSVAQKDLKDLGEFKYSKTKNLHLFLYEVDKVDVKKLECKSFFTQWGRQMPEINGFKLTPITDLSPFYKSIQKVLSKIL